MLDFFKKTKKNRLIVTTKKLDGDGERVDIDYTGRIKYKNFNIYQKSHFQRYRYATEFLAPNYNCGDFSCGTGYGTVMLAEKCRNVIGIDSNADVIDIIKERYGDKRNVVFYTLDLLDMDIKGDLDCIVSFETIEHFSEPDIVKLLRKYNRALKSNGLLLFSVPYMQIKPSQANIPMFHLTFDIDEKKISDWFEKTDFESLFYKYQNYATHEICDDLSHKDFIIGGARKVN